MTNRYEVSEVVEIGAAQDVVLGPKDVEAFDSENGSELTREIPFLADADE